MFCQIMTGAGADEEEENDDDDDRVGRAAAAKEGEVVSKTFARAQPCLHHRVPIANAAEPSRGRGPKRIETLDSSLGFRAVIHQLRDASRLCYYLEAVKSVRVRKAS